MTGDRDLRTVISVALLSILMLAPTPASGGVIFVNPGDPGTTPGHPARAWTEVEMAIVNEALDEWRTFVENFDRILGTWTLRWEDEDLFKNLTTAAGGGDNYTNVPGVTVRPGNWAAGGFPSPPNNSPDFPEGEIYFNATLAEKWFFDPTPATDDPGEPPAGKLDFVTAAKHEIGHALGIFGHLPDDPRGPINLIGAMEERLGEGERDRVGPLDITLFRQQVPEPSGVLLVVSGLLALGGLAWYRR